MTSRRELMAAVLGSLVATLMAARPAEQKRLEVTYYYLPG
jgi:hypothetical protein